MPSSTVSKQNKEQVIEFFLILESGFQKYTEKIEEELCLVDGAKQCVQHEFLKGDDLLERAADKMEVVAEELNGLLETLRKRFGNDYIEYLRIKKVIMKFLAAWGPDINGLPFTKTIYDGMGPWDDAYGNRHPCKQGDGDVYDDSLFDVPDHEFAKETIDEFVNRTMKAGGEVGGLNENKCAFRYMGTTAEEYLVDSGWEPLDDCLEGVGLKVYR